VSQSVLLKRDERCETDAYSCYRGRMWVRSVDTPTKSGTYFYQGVATVLGGLPKDCLKYWVSCAAGSGRQGTLWYWRGKQEIVHTTLERGTVDGRQPQLSEGSCFEAVWVWHDVWGGAGATVEGKGGALVGDQCCKDFSDACQLECTGVVCANSGAAYAVCLLQVFKASRGSPVCGRSGARVSSG
jgi:hypothetical protein